LYKHLNFKSILKKYEELLMNLELRYSSYTLNSAYVLEPILEHIRDEDIKTMLDLGCGYGILTVAIAEFLGVKKIYGVDVDEVRLKYLTEHVIKRADNIEFVALQQDFSKPLHLPEKVQLVTSFGSLEHTMCWDETLENIKNSLVKGGYIIISMPNLASWVNRLMLFLGYQPRDLEISQKKLYGVAPPFKTHGVIGHVRVATFKAFYEFLVDSGFDIVMTKPLYSKANPIVNFLDGLLSKPSLSRRYVFLARKL
jgi:SAM-dependent methyltransferase